MKLLTRGIIAILLLCLSGCGSISRNIYYSNLAKEYPFEYFFPSDNFFKDFSSIDEAYEYINTATAKFSNTVSNKRRDKGLAARIYGPEIEDNPVSVVCMIRASDTNGNIDLSEIDQETGAVLRRADDAVLFFCIFYADRIVSLSNFYLDSRYSGYSSGNAQIKSFRINGQSYEADYPVGWGIEEAFNYLRRIE